jgi:hypothetical protein
MSSEFELILHHTYSSWGGLPVDLSDYDSHGRASLVDYLPDGATPGSGALTFTTKSSRVSVPSTPAQKSLTALKVELTARFRLIFFGLVAETLVAGHESFSVRLFPATHHLDVAFVRSSTVPKTYSYGLNSGADGVVSPRWSMPFDTWVQLVIVHDGLNTIRLYADGRLVAQRTDVLASVPPVGFLGISIGNEPDSDHQSFHGSDIDEVKVWRLDPNLMDRQFLTRPMNNDVAACWTRFFASLRKALKQNPECAREMSVAITAIIDELQRAILAQGLEARDRYISTCIRYRHLWKQGHIDGLAMAELVAEWIAWLRLTGFSFQNISGLAVFFRNPCLRDILPLCAPLECDPHFLVFMAFILGITQESGSILQEGSYGRRY